MKHLQHDEILSIRAGRPVFSCVLADGSRSREEAVVLGGKDGIALVPCEHCRNELTLYAMSKLVGSSQSFKEGDFEFNSMISVKRTKS